MARRITIQDFAKQYNQDTLSVVVEAVSLGMYDPATQELPPKRVPELLEALNIISKPTLPL